MVAARHERAATTNEQRGQSAFSDDEEGGVWRRRRRRQRCGCARRPRRRPWREEGRHHARIFFGRGVFKTGRMDILRRLETWPELPGEETIPTLTRAVAYMLRNEDARRALVLVCKEKCLGHVVRPCLDTVVTCVEAKLFSVSRRERRRLGRAPLRGAVKAEVVGDDCKESCPRSRGRPYATGRSFDAKTDGTTCPEAEVAGPTTQRDV